MRVERLCERLHVCGLYSATRSEPGDPQWRDAQPEPGDVSTALLDIDPDARVRLRQGAARRNADRHQVAS